MSKIDIATSMNNIMNSSSYQAVFAKPQLTKTAAKKKDEDEADKKKGKKEDDKKDKKKEDKKEGKGKKAKAMNKYQACVIGLAKISETLDKETNPRIEKAASLVFAALDALVKGAMPTGELDGTSDCGMASDKKKDDDNKDKSEKKNPFAKKDDDEEEEDDEDEDEEEDEDEDDADDRKGKCLPGDPMCETLDADDEDKKCLPGDPVCETLDADDEDDASDWYNKLMEKVVDPAHPEHSAVTETLGGDGPEDPEFDEDDIEQLLSAINDDSESIPDEFSFVSIEDQDDDIRSKMDQEDEEDDYIQYKSLAGRKLNSLQKLALELKKRR